MHKTLVNDVNGYIDAITDDIICGWAFHVNEGVLPTRLRLHNIGDDVKTSQTNDNTELHMRIDVSEFYKNDKIINCGFGFGVRDIKLLERNFTIEMYIENAWQAIFEFNNNKHFTPIINRNNLSFIIVDNFYQDPDKVRNFALSQTFNHHPQCHKGKRTEVVFRFDGLKEEFEYHTNKRVKNWHEYGVNGCFQICVAGDQLVYHYDTQEYAAIIFLTPDAPPETGTNFYRSKNTKDRKIFDYADTNIIFKTGFLDSTQFDLIDQVGNVYNRLVIFDAKMIHAAACYFGDNDNNGRLFQMFFFDLE